MRNSYTKYCCGVTGLGLSTLIFKFASMNLIEVKLKQSKLFKNYFCRTEMSPYLLTNHIIWPVVPRTEEMLDPNCSVP